MVIACLVAVAGVQNPFKYFLKYELCRFSVISYIYTWKKVKEHPLFQINFHMDLNNGKAVDKTRNIISSL